MSVLDRSRHYGEVYGLCPYRYEQDGKYFNHSGLECDIDGKPVEGGARPSTADSKLDAALAKVKELEAKLSNPAGASSEAIEKMIERIDALEKENAELKKPKPKPKKKVTPNVETKRSPRKRVSEG